MIEDNTPPELIAPPGKPWLTWFMGLVFISGILIWWMGPGLVRKGNAWMAGHHAQKATDWMEKQEWMQAYQSLEKARGWKPDHPRLLRVLTDFLIATQGDTATILHHLRMIEMMGQITEADLIKMGQIHVQQSDAASALAALAKLPNKAREARPAMEIYANIYRLQGRPQLAEDTLRRALNLDKDDPMCRLRLALMDQSAAFGEMREQARQSLWQLTTGKDKAALLAIDHLARDMKLTPPEADKLVESIESHPDKTDEARFTVLTGLLRTRPEKKKDIFATDLARMQTLTAETLGPSLVWLLREKQPQHIVSFRPREFFTKSSQLIQPYLQALGDLGRWEEVDKLLSRPAGMPISSAFIAFWRAKATRNLDTETTRVRQHLATAYEATGHGRDGAIATAAAALAEESGVWDIAALFYEGLAEHQPKMELTMLQKVHEMAMRSRDSDAVLKSSARLLALRPENRRFVMDELYLHLVCGKEIELRRLKLDRPESSQLSDEDRLCLALAAYRFGDLNELREHLATISDPLTLRPGQRAVHAGLLTISGQVGRAYQIAEQVPTLLLLKEEARFLQRAL
jgi:tetratricopeptide (TPR) repeat protein